MDIWRDIRRTARQRHHEAAAKAKDHSAGSLAVAGLKAARLSASRFVPGSIYGEGVLGALEREDRVVRLSSALDVTEVPVVTAHEIGHWWLHDEPAYMIRSLEAGFGGAPFETGAERVIAYSTKERREIQADVFAQEFLLPSDKLRERLVRDGKRPSEIATEMGLPPQFVRMQAMRALLLPPLDEREERNDDPIVPLDDDQRKAAEWDERPLILDAGPGTGKTRTLVARIEHLLARKVPASSILALTFSNKAAAEMVERVGRIDAEAAPQIWIGTFHSFGLELLRLHHAAAGLPENFKILDEAGSLAILEDRLSDLDLDHFQNLWDPTLELRSIVRAISRAKDEMVSAEEYAAAAQETYDAAKSTDEIARAEKAMEVARAYRIYEETLQARQCVDFGDLIGKVVRLLRENPDVLRETRARHDYVLVDEYQDVNQASTELVDLLADRGRKIWAVADPRQSIYRFRGAAPANAAAFTDRYDDARRLPLGTNYRSCESVVRVFEKFGSTIASTPDPKTTWRANRGRVGFVDVLHAPDLLSEAAAVRDQIERLRKERSIPYERQAILARTHLCLARFGKLLQHLGVPVLYLGDLFERPEIRDLLSLVSLGADPSGAGLVRVAQLPEYGATRTDALVVIREAAQREEDILATLKRVETLDSLTDQGRFGLSRLAEHLAAVEWKTSAWAMLSEYLLEKSEYLRPLLQAEDVAARQSLLAIYQFLKFCREHHDAQRGAGGRRPLLEAVRRLERLDDDKAFRVVPPEAEGIPAVRMLTLHASKGLEFQAVHLPQIATRYVPHRKHPVACPAPVGLERLEIGKTDHDAEEECLFFVALSRARDVLTINSAGTYTGNQTCNPSKYLDRLKGILPASRKATATSPLHAPVAMEPPSPSADFEERHIEIYFRCPARYRYEVVEELGGLVRKSAFLRFHGTVRQAIGWICDRIGEGNPVTPDEAVEQLREIWSKRGPVGEAFEDVYWRNAEKMLRTTATRAIDGGPPAERVWSTSLAGSLITLRPDRVYEAADGTIVAQRFKTGRKSKSEADNAIWALMGEAGAALFLGRAIRLEAFYPALGETDPITPDRTAMKAYLDALAGIRSGDFRPVPKDPRDCPSCQFYFICTRDAG
ncbi:ATP-dependent helicase [Methylobacterium aerolatum]|uniref:DNA 3'-5' helicase n=1 Tax=Methylobacterium aerolatum TaxID=418708 RepID=A0ABU0I1Z9_9HYPH|nr:ATP-dependent helicase [Methylobacterium aerolatum]MDQ0448122.1 superfamily I DNA/RNA helicase [Methylobacterium aerolatum]GJD34009.1 ATP-dependent DNA helicase Rep [Methylobacterium aerolatum]